MCTKLQLNHITNEVSNEVQKIFGNNLHKIILFGSYARDDYDNESDIDIMIIADINNNEKRTFQKAVDKISSKISLDNDITVCVLLKDRLFFNSHIDELPFYQNVINEGKEVYAV